MNARCSLCGQHGSRGQRYSVALCLLESINRCGPCLGLIKLEDKICEAEAVLDELIAQRHALKTRINKVHDPFAMKLPPELVSRIFAFGMPADYRVSSTSPSLALKRPAPPLLFGSVSRTWREIAWSTPQLWNRFHVHLRREDSQCLVKTVEEYLARSGHLPLSIHILAAGATALSSDATEVFKPIFDVINLHSNRWRDLDVSLPPPLVALIRGKAPMLEYLRLAILGRSEVDRHGNRAEFTPSDDRPAPTTVEVEGVPFSRLMINWTNVTRLNFIGKIYVDECLHILQQAPQMLSCQIFSISEGGTVPIPDKPFVHQHLQSLSVDMIGRRTSEVLSSRLSLPSVKEMKFPDGPVDSLRLLVARSSCRLTKLTVGDTQATQTALIQLLHATPFLESLFLVDVPVKTGFLTFLAETSLAGAVDGDNKPNFLPYLQRMYLSGICRFSFTSIPVLFPSTSEAESHCRRPFQSLKIDVEGGLSGPIDQQVLEQLLKIIDAGFEVSITNEKREVDFIKRSQVYYHRQAEEKASRMI